MIGVALLGAGIFAREEHLPAIEANPNLQLRAVYSRSRKSAEALAALARDPASVALYYDTPAEAGRSLDDLLQRGDGVSAVVVALPIVQQPAVVERALRAGKHVLSEKPVAADVAGARALLARYDELLRADAGRDKTRPLWAVAENYRYTPSLVWAAQRVAEIGGELLTFRLQKYGLMRADNKYFNTEWRKVPEHQGGFLLDGGVHFVAALRMLLAAAGGQQIRRLAGFSGLLDERLVPVDTVHAAAATQDGKTGTIAMSFGTEFKSGLEVEVVTTRGSVVWTPTEVRTVTRKAAGGGAGETVEERREFPYDTGVKPEVDAFAAAIAAGELDERQTPLEALRDLEILQGLLESGAGGALVKTIGL